MDSIRLKARAKINLGLDVLGKREDGYHEVRMVMQTIGIYDRLILTKIPEEEIRITSNLAFLPVNENNLIYKAIKLLKDYLKKSEYSFEYIHENIRGEERFEKITNYKKDPNIFILLLSSKTMLVDTCFGSVNSIIVYESNWDPKEDILTGFNIVNNQPQFIRLLIENSFEKLMFDKKNIFIDNLYINNYLLHICTRKLHRFYETRGVGAREK